ncbi:MAG: hypothetical protein CMJ94_07535 [Planctomycetes bacterium]|nr:hypothetical protein [Planctomycetota bacterium]
MGYSTGEAIQENAEAAYWEEVQRLSDETINELLRGQAVSLLDFESGQELARHLKKSLVAKSIAAAESDAKAARELAKETHKLNVRTTQATVVIAIASALMALFALLDLLGSPAVVDHAASDHGSTQAGQQPFAPPLSG